MWRIVNTYDVSSLQVDAAAQVLRAYDDTNKSLRGALREYDIADTKHREQFLDGMGYVPDTEAGRELKALRMRQLLWSAQYVEYQTSMRNGVAAPYPLQLRAMVAMNGLMCMSLNALERADPRLFAAVQFVNQVYNTGFLLVNSPAEPCTEIVSAAVGGCAAGIAIIIASVRMRHAAALRRHVIAHLALKTMVVASCANVVVSRLVETSESGASAVHWINRKLYGAGIIFDREPLPLVAGIQVYPVVRNKLTGKESVMQEPVSELSTSAGRAAVMHTCGVRLMWGLLLVYMGGKVDRAVKARLQRQPRILQLTAASAVYVALCAVCFPLSYALLDDKLRLSGTNIEPRVASSAVCLVGTNEEVLGYSFSRGK